MLYSYNGHSQASRWKLCPCRWGELPEVKISSPNLIHQATPAGYFTITDQYYSNQWEHQKINSELAWMITKGDGQVRIGIMDNGIDHTHYDLDANIWKDGQGNVLGGDFTSDVFSTGRPYGDESHGTHAAGIAAAPINGTGVVGASPNVRLVPLKIATGQNGTSRSWYVNQTGLISAFDYATVNDIEILSMSWGLSSWSGNISVFNQAISDAINDGRDGKGIIMVAAAGNDGNNPPVDLIAQNVNMIAVGATNPQDQRWPGSSYEPNELGHFVDIAAPAGWTQSEGCTVILPT